MDTREQPTVASVGEHALIARLRDRIGPPPRGVLIGAGDDAAVLAPLPGQASVLTTDSLVEGVHFRRDWTPPDAIGHKALAVNLSDLAAMGAEPRAALLSLALPDDLPLAHFDALLEGFLALAARTRTPLVGGNLTRSPGPLVVDVTAAGAAPPRKLLTRAGGRPGDELYVTGALGAAAAGLALRRAGQAATTPADVDCLEAADRPEPRVRVGLAVARASAAAAAVDLSDGLADAVRQLAAASGTGAVVVAAHVPVHPGAAAAEPADGGLGLALSGGEDYELLFAVRRRSRRRFLAVLGRFRPLPVACIGRLTTGRTVQLDAAGRLASLPDGFRHFGATDIRNGR